MYAEVCTENQPHSAEKAIPNSAPAVPDRVLREIAAIARKSDADRVILFGSRARGTHFIPAFAALEATLKQKWEMP